jgi:hypothetical protein
MLDVRETFWWLLALLAVGMALFWVTASIRRWRVGRGEKRAKDVRHDIRRD